MNTWIAIVLALGPEPAEVEAEPRAVATASLDEGFGVSDHDGRFGIRLGFFGQFRGGWAIEHGETEYGVSIPVARPILAANLWGRRVRARLMPEFAGSSPKLLDATATIELHEAFSVQLGQYRPWLSRGYRTGLPVQALGARGSIVDAFKIGRDVGITVLGRPWHGRFEYYIGVMNGQGTGSVHAGPLPLFTARVVVAPMGAVPYSQTPYLDADAEVRIAMGASGYAVEREAPQTEPTEPTASSHRDYGGSLDAVVSSRRVYAQFEGFMRADEDDLGMPRREAGLYAQVGALLVRDRLDLSVRAGGLDRDAWQVPLESALGVYFAHNHAKLQLRYACGLDPGEGACGSQLATAQAQLRF